MKLNKAKYYLLRFQILSIVTLLSACNSLNVRDINDIKTIIEKPDAVKQVIKNRGQSYVESQIPTDVRALKATIEKFLKQIDKIWGKDDAKQSSPKEYVKYTDNYYNRAHINFDNGTVTVETLAPSSQEEYLKKAIITTLLTPDDPRQVDLYSDAAPKGEGTPFLYEQVLDQDGKPIQWEWRANRYAEYLIKNKINKVKIGSKNGLRVIFPLVKTHQNIRAYKYASIVRKYSKKYNVTESLIYAIIKTESSFNPFAVSHAPAYGLMQIVPSTAGRDVFEKIKKTSGQPTPQNLYDPEYNIDMGTAYVKILQEQYLVKVTDKNARRYTVISAYNGGAGNVFKTFSSNRNQAMVKINQLSSNEVYEQLTNKHPKQESRRYLYKVNEAQKEFWRTPAWK